jgi:multidrug efflux system membrane fusion protein
MVTALAPAADSATRLFQVELTVANPERVLLPGMVATLSLSSEPANQSQPVLTVPLSAVIGGKEGNEQFAVVVVENQRAHRRSVTVGETFGNRITVSGVRAGETVISTGAALVEEGETVQVIP